MSGDGWFRKSTLNDDPEEVVTDLGEVEVVDHHKLVGLQVDIFEHVEHELKG